jgi:hypothetical protein
VTQGHEYGHNIERESVEGANYMQRALMCLISHHQVGGGGGAGGKGEVGEQCLEV